MKKLRVVWRAGPISSNWPRPIPSNWDKNSFSPFERRDVHAAVAEGETDFVPFIGLTATAAATWLRAGGGNLDGSGALVTVRNLSNRLILVRGVSGCFHCQGLDWGCSGSFFLCARVPRIVGTRNFHLAVNLGTLFDCKSKRRDITANVTCASYF